MDSDSLVCYNRGCGKRFKENENVEGKPIQNDIEAFAPGHYLLSNVPMPMACKN